MSMLTKSNAILICGIWVISLPLAAKPLPRDDAMSNAFRCNTISEDHQWLDCFYGSAQPVRDALGLPGATDAQLKLAEQPPQGGVITSSAARNKTLANASRCYDLSEDRNWLQCYYDAAQEFRALIGLSHSLPAAQNRTEALQNTFATRSKPRENARGISTWLIGSSQSIKVGMLSYSFDRAKQFTVSLANGQVWRQVPGDTRVAEWHRPAAIYSVIITRGVLGSMNLRVAGEAGMFKVDRVL